MLYTFFSSRIYMHKNMDITTYFVKIIISLLSVSPINYIVALKDYYTLRLWPLGGTSWQYPLCQGAALTIGYDIHYIDIVHPYDSHYTDCAPCNCYLFPTGSTDVQSITINFSNNFYQPRRHMYTYRDWSGVQPTEHFTFSIQAHTTYTLLIVHLNDGYKQVYSMFEDRRISLYIDGGTMDMRCSNNNFTSVLEEQSSTTSSTMTTTTRLLTPNFPSKLSTKSNASSTVQPTTQSHFRMTTKTYSISDTQTDNDSMVMGSSMIGKTEDDRATELSMIIGSIVVLIILFILIFTAIVLFITKKRILTYCIEHEKRQEIRKEIYTKDPSSTNGMILYEKNDEKIFEDRCIYADGEKKYFCLAHHNKDRGTGTILPGIKQSKSCLSSSSISNRTSTNNADSDYSSCAPDIVNNYESVSTTQNDGYLNRNEETDDKKDNSVAENNSDGDTTNTTLIKCESCDISPKIISYPQNYDCKVKSLDSQHNLKQKKATHTSFFEPSIKIDLNRRDNFTTQTAISPDSAEQLERSANNFKLQSYVFKAESPDTIDNIRVNKHQSNFSPKGYSTDINQYKANSPSISFQNKSTAVEKTDNSRSSSISEINNEDNNRASLTSQFLTELNKKLPVMQNNTTTKNPENLHVSNQMKQNGMISAENSSGGHIPSNIPHLENNQHANHKPYIPGKKHSPLKPTIPAKPQLLGQHKTNSKTLPYGITMNAFHNNQYTSSPPAQAKHSHQYTSSPPAQPKHSHQYTSSPPAQPKHSNQYTSSPQARPKHSNQYTSSPPAQPKHSFITDNRRKTLPATTSNMQKEIISSNIENAIPKYAKIGSNHERTLSLGHDPTILSNHERTLSLGHQPTILSNHERTISLHHEPTTLSTNDTQDDPCSHYATIDLTSLVKRQKPPPTKAPENIIYAQLDLKNYKKIEL